MSTPCATAWARTAASRAIDGPTFLCTIGWDWIPAIRDRDTGIWQKVFLSATGPVLIKDPLVTTDLPLPRTDSADVAVQAQSRTSPISRRKACSKGSIENIAFSRQLSWRRTAQQTVTFDAADRSRRCTSSIPASGGRTATARRISTSCTSSFDQDNTSLRRQDVTFGVRKITYTVPGSET